MLRLGTVAKPLLLEFRNAWSRQIRALLFTSVYDQMSQEPPLLTITFFFATCIKYPRTLARLRCPNCR